MAIQSLQWRMSYEEALRKLSATGPLGGLRRWISGPLRGIAEIYLPYRLYKVGVNDPSLQSVHHYAVDATAGTLDPYEFAKPPAADEWMEVETRNFHPARLNETETRKLVTEKVRRLLYSRGFFRVVNPSITAELVQSEFYIPYWAGFYGDEKNMSLTVLNAVRQTVEGKKARWLIKAWLLERDSQRDLNLAF
jgi:hypothetical protein